MFQFHQLTQLTQLTTLHKLSPFVVKRLIHFLSNQDIIHLGQTCKKMLPLYHTGCDNLSINTQWNKTLTILSNFKLPNECDQFHPINVFFDDSGSYYVDILWLGVRLRWFQKDGAIFLQLLPIRNLLIKKTLLLIDLGKETKFSSNITNKKLFIFLNNIDTNSKISAIEFKYHKLIVNDKFDNLIKFHTTELRLPQIYDVVIGSQKRGIAFYCGAQQCHVYRKMITTVIPNIHYQNVLICWNSMRYIVYSLDRDSYLLDTKTTDSIKIENFQVKLNNRLAFDDFFVYCKIFREFWMFVKRKVYVFKVVNNVAQQKFVTNYQSDEIFCPYLKKVIKRDKN